jgi:bifunctional non-homologous end joining protein LigD
LDQLKPARFIEPSSPVLRSEPPTGREWLHEVKHDGWRAPLNLHDGTPRIYSKRGLELTCRFRSIADAVARLPAKSLILDAELVACDAEGKPSSGELMSGARRGCCAYVFDLLQDDDEMHTAAPLEYRRARLRKLLKRARLDALRFWDDFDDPVPLLDACARHGLEGIVSKLREDRHRSGTNRGWIKVKTAEWKAGNSERWRMFE